MRIRTMLPSLLLHYFLDIFSLVPPPSLIEGNTARLDHVQPEITLPSSRWRRSISQSMRRSRNDGLTPRGAPASEYSEIDNQLIIHSAKDESKNRHSHPQVTRLSDGTMLSIETTMQVNGSIDIMRVLKSTDGGKSFNPLGEITRGENRGINTGFLVEVPRSPVLLVVYRNDDLDSSGNPTAYRITVSRSEDRGYTWKEASHIVKQSLEDSLDIGGLQLSVQIGRRGNLQLTYSRKLARGRQDTFRATSYDGGRSWSKPINMRNAYREDT
ncbi:hypothetical protein GGS26DRAFT_193721 [Hypomontagnella submonticulosa]|nr:hypothetical protein GGS26DRAFT_193721 [Hypomontagnella submonticulosa]